MRSNSCKNTNDTASQSIDIESHVCLGDTSAQILQKFKSFMSETGHERESFPDRIIFASNDKTVPDICPARAKGVAAHAARFRRCCWCFCHTRLKLCASLKRSGLARTETGTKLTNCAHCGHQRRSGCANLKSATNTSDGVTRHRTVRRQPPAARLRLDFLDELRRTPPELKPGSRGSALGLRHTSFAPPPKENATPAREPSQRQQVEQIAPPQSSVGTAGEDTGSGATEGEPDHTNSNTLFRGCPKMGLLTQQDSDLVVGVCHPGSEMTWNYNEDRPSHHFAHGEWDKLALRMMGEFTISKHLTCKCSNILQTGVLMGRKGGKGKGREGEGEGKGGGEGKWKGKGEGEGEGEGKGGTRFKKTSLKIISCS